MISNWCICVVTMMVVVVSAGVSSSSPKFVTIDFGWCDSGEGSMPIGVEKAIDGAKGSYVTVRPFRACVSVVDRVAGCE